MAQPDSTGNSIRDRLRGRLGLGAAPEAPAAASPELPGYRTNSGLRGAAFQQTPTPTNPSFRPAAPEPPGLLARGAESLGLYKPGAGIVRNGLRALGRGAAPAAAAVMEVPTAYNEWQETGDLGRSLARSGIRVAGTAAGSTLGGLGAGALGIESGPGALITGAIGTAAGGAAGYKAGDWAADEFLPKRAKGAFSNVRGGVSSTESINPANARVRLIEPGSDIAPPVPADLYDNQRLRERYGAAAVAPGAKPTPTVDAGKAADPLQLRTRTQGAVIENPNAMSAEDRLYFASKRFKGSPSMRRAAADLILGGEQRKDANRQAELNANMAADAAMAQSNTEGQRLFADRKLRAQMFNTNLEEDARQANQKAKVDLLTGMLGGRRSGKTDLDADFTSRIYEDTLKQTNDPALAAQAANRARVAAGVTDDSPLSEWAQTQDTIRTNEGLRRHADRWFGWGDSDIDPATASPVDTAGFWAGVLPGGADPGDVRMRDANGNEAWATADSLPPGETAEAFALRKRMQDRLREKRKQQGAE